MRSQYDAQAAFIADKMREITSIELDSAVMHDGLKFIKKESIAAIVELVYWYFKELNRPYGGGLACCNINTIIETALVSYKYAKEGIKSSPFLQDDDWKKLLAETEEAFRAQVVGLDIQLEGLTLDDFPGGANPHRFVKEPIFYFSYVGNAYDFAVDMRETSGLMVREQYFDKKGHILPTPIVKRCVGGEWVDTPPSKVKRPIVRPSDLK